MRALVTAGNTRESIDQVRDWGNIFTGNTGYAIARALAEIAEVDLLTSNTRHLEEIRANPSGLAHPLHASGFRDHAELRGSLAAMMSRQKYDAIFMTAAVADYRPVRSFAVIARHPGTELGTEQWVVKDVQAAKVKSDHPEVAFLGEKTEKLVDLFRTAWGYQGLLVKFKLEVGIPPEELIRVGQASRVASGADYLVANTLDMVQGENAGAYLLGATGHKFIPREQLPARLVQLMLETVKPPFAAG